MRKVRVVVYEGDAEWLEATIARSLPIGPRLCQGSLLYPGGGVITVWEQGAIAPSVMKDAPRDRPILALCEESGLIDRSWHIIRWNEMAKMWMPRFCDFFVNPLLWLELPPTEDEA